MSVFYFSLETDEKEEVSGRNSVLDWHCMLVTKFKHPLASTSSGTDIIVNATTPTSPIIANTANIASVVGLISIKSELIVFYLSLLR